MDQSIFARYYTLQNQCYSIALSPQSQLTQIAILCTLLSNSYLKSEPKPLENGHVNVSDIIQLSSKI